MITERCLAFLDCFPCLWHYSEGFRHIISLNSHNMNSPSEQMGKLQSSEAKNLPKLAQVTELGLQPMPESSLFTSGEGFVFHRNVLWNTHKSSDLSAAGNEEAGKGGHAVLALKHLLFCKKKQAWAGAFRVYTVHDKYWTTGRDKETCLCLCSKALASWTFIWLSEEGSWCHLSLEGREGIQSDTTVYTKAVTAAMKLKDALWKKSYDQPRQHIKKQRHYFDNKGLSNQGYDFSSSHVEMWELDSKESWVPNNWCFRTVVLEKTLDSPLDGKESKPVNPKGNESWIFIGRTDAEAETPILWPPDVKNWLIEKDPYAGKDWRQEEKGTTKDEMVGWHHRLDGHEFE